MTKKEMLDLIEILHQKEEYHKNGTYVRTLSNIADRVSLIKLFLESLESLEGKNETNNGGC